jgi:hypothetical protein
MLNLSLPAARAGQEEIGPDREAVSPSPFDKNGHEFQIGIGYGFTTETGGALQPGLEDVDINLRYGWMLTSPGGSRLLRGNWEMAIEAMAAEITGGPGAAFAGGAFLFRYNFVQASSRWVPYVQAGFGGLYSDTYREHPQRLIGEAFEFYLQAALGSRRPQLRAEQHHRAGGRQFVLVARKLRRRNRALPSFSAAAFRPSRR